MTAETRRNRGPGRAGGPPGRAGQPRPDVRRTRTRVAGQRAAERRRQETTPEPRPPRRLVLPTPRLPRLRRPRAQRPATAPRPASLSRRLTGVLAVLVLLSAVAVGYLAVQLRQAQATESAAVDAQVTAARYAEQLLSYHHAHLARDFAESRALMTDAFVQEYAEATDVVREQAIKDRAVIEASAVATSVVSARPDEVRTLLFVNQTTTTGTSGGSPSIDLNRVVMTLVEEDGGWLVSDLDAM
jgi:hypothetical protein